MQSWDMFYCLLFENMDKEMYIYEYTYRSYAKLFALSKYEQRILKDL